jgi:hypothetical protein
MKIVLAFVFLLAACAPAVQEEKITEQTPADMGKWLPQQRQEHPEWYTCETDQDCTAVPGECGTVCRGETVNNKAYSDYVVALSKACQGASQTIRNCEQVEKACVAGMCQLV